MIYTSYYSNVKNIPSDYTLYQISNSAPKIDRKILKLTALIPNWFYVRSHKSKSITDVEFREKYIAKLDEAITENFIKAVAEFDNNKDKHIVFLCYERPDGFCHRHILADYLNGKWALNVQEFKA